MRRMKLIHAFLILSAPLNWISSGRTRISSSSTFLASPLYEQDDSDDSGKRPSQSGATSTGRCSATIIRGTKEDRLLAHGFFAGATGLRVV
jgi:hypothetical protein